MQSIQLADFDRDALRTRLRKMSDEELREFGKAARYMTSPTSEYGQTAAANFRAAVRGSSGGVAPKTSRRRSAVSSISFQTERR
jgi:hypothetical protein